jgi:GntR family transcriptional regulator
MKGQVRRKHERVSAALEREIRSGRMASGARLPGEHTLAQRFGVSRATVRAALADLNDAGLIATRTGKGSYVTFDGRPLDDRLGWARALAANGVEARVRLVGISAVSDDVALVERVRELAAGAVISYERSYVPALPGLLEEGLVDGSLTATLARVGLIAHHGEQRVGCRRVDAAEAAVLGCEAGAWFLRTRKSSWTVAGDWVEHVDSLLDPAHFELSLAFGERVDA